MIVVGSMWEYGWNTPIKEIDLWHFPMKELGVDKLAMAPVSGILSKEVQEFDSIENMVAYYGLPVVICSEHGESELEEFEHPHDALYLFNRTSGGNLPVKEDFSVRIKTKLNKGMFWGHQAASIILYDRLRKEWQ